MPVRPINSREYFFALTLMHYALIVGPVLLSLIFLWINLSDSNSNGAMNESPVNLNYIVPVLVILGVITSYFFNKKLIPALQEKPDLKDKLNGYQNLVIIRNALLEAPALISIIGFFLMSDYLFLGYATICILLLLIQTPSRSRVINDLALSFEETERIKDPDAIVAEKKEP